MSEKEEMKNDIVGSLACLLMENDPALSMEQAMALVFNSDTYQKLFNDKTGLYYQSPRYVYSFLEDELETGKIA